MNLRKINFVTYLNIFILIKGCYSENQYLRKKKSYESNFMLPTWKRRNQMEPSIFPPHRRIYFNHGTFNRKGV